MYDADGRLTRSIEPNGGGLTSAAQISYAYYANGLRSAVSVASAGLTQSNVLTYSYRVDGAMRTQSVNAFSSGTWSNGYTDAGRITSVSGVNTQSHTYDTTGQLATYGVSAGTAIYTHDPEGSVLTEYLPNVMLPGAGAAVPETIAITLNLRGEIVDSAGGPQSHRRTTTNSGCSSTSTIPDDLSQYDPGNDSTVSPATCDRVNGISVAADSSIQSTTSGGQTYTTGTTNSESFDGTGRIVQTVHTAYGAAQRNGSQAHVPAHGSGDPGAGDAGAGTAGGPTDTISSFTRTTSARAYDVENHFRTVQTTRRATGANQQSYTITGPATTIGWGPNGHPANISVNFGGTTTNETLHWDGDTILFVTDAAGNVTDFKVGLDGDITPRDGTFSGLSVYDRDPAGVIVQTSNSTGSTGFNPLDPNTVTGAGAAGTAGYQAANIPEQYVRGDGFMVAGVQINGVRAFDPNLGAWTTPDAYEGEVHDPVSQQRYMWNRGNAVDYSDPSGYDCQRVDQAVEAVLLGGVEAGLSRGLVEKALSQNVRAASLRSSSNQASSQPKGGTYSLRTANGNVVRNGRSSNLKSRAGDHARGYKGVEFKVEYRTDDKAAQRGLEQYQQDTQPGILDKVRGISPMNPNKATYEKARDDFLNTLRRGY